MSRKSIRKDDNNGVDVPSTTKGARPDEIVTTPSSVPVVESVPRAQSETTASAVQESSVTQAQRHRIMTADISLHLRNLSSVKVQGTIVSVAGNAALFVDVSKKPIVVLLNGDQQYRAPMRVSISFGRETSVSVGSTPIVSLRDAAINPLATQVNDKETFETPKIAELQESSFLPIIVCKVTNVEPLLLSDETGTIALQGDVIGLFIEGDVVAVTNVNVSAAAEKRAAKFFACATQASYAFPLVTQIAEVNLTRCDLLPIACLTLLDAVARPEGTILSVDGPLTVDKVVELMVTKRNGSKGPIVEVTIRQGAVATRFTAWDLPLQNQMKALQPGALVKLEYVRVGTFQKQNFLLSTSNTVATVVMRSVSRSSASFAPPEDEPETTWDALRM